tara:strand:+ start:266 stop:778 length:513 start_codon:yes stop_codon:yes gene_type:complete
MIEWTEIKYPSIFVKLADEIANLRTFHSKHVYKKGTEKYRGEQEHSISMLGILSELIARHHLETQGLNYEAALLVDENPIVAADIIMNGLGINYKIDVKGLKSNSDFLRINYKAHNNPKKDITHYLFIQPLTNTEARFCWAKNEQIKDWEVIESTYTKCYQKKINDENSK